MIGLNVWFTIEVLDVVRTSGVEPAALVVAFFGFTTGELCIVSSIKKNKDRIKGEIDLQSSGE